MAVLATSAAQAVAGHPGSETLSLLRALGLLSRLRLTRWRNRARQVFNSASASQPSSGWRSAGTHGGRAVGLVAVGAVVLALFSVQSFSFFEDVAREHGAHGVQGRALLLSSLLCFAVLMTAIAGNGIQQRPAAEEREWLMTLPIRPWVLQTAQLGEAALSNLAGWMLIFPFLTGLGLHVGLGVAAPLVALGLAAPIFVLCALLAALSDLANRWFSSARLRVVRALAASIGALVLIVWFGAPALGRLQLAPLGHWLNFSAEISWLPFCEPARVITWLPRDPTRALAWLGLFAAEVALSLGLGVLVLRAAHRVSLQEGRGGRQRARGSERAPGHVVGRGVFGPVATKDLLWLRRNPTRTAGLALNAVLANIAAMIWLSRSDVAALPALTGGALFGVGLWQIGLSVVLLEAERPALWQLSALPRSLSRFFWSKTLFAAGWAATAALPIVIYASRALPHFGAALPALCYATAGLVLIAFLQTALWLYQLDPSVAPSPLQHVLRSVQLMFVAGFFAAGFASPTVGRYAVLLVFAGSLAFTSWYDALARLPFALDSSAPRARALTATYALAAVVVMHTLQVRLHVSAAQAGWYPPLALVVSFVVAGSTTLSASLLWLRYREVAGLGQRLGLCLGARWPVTLREGVLWSVPALVVCAGFGWLSRSGVGSSQAPPTAVGMLAAGSKGGFTVMTVLAAPILEELLFRGMLYRALRSRWGVAFSTLLSCAVFTVGHPLVAAVPVFCMAGCATLAFERSKSLWSAVLVHTSYNGCIAWIVLSS